MDEDEKDVQCPHCGAQLNAWDVFEYQQSEGHEGCSQCNQEVSNEEWIRL